MGKINRELLAASGIEFLFNAFDQLPKAKKVDFHDLDFADGCVKLRAWNEQQKQDFVNRWARKMIGKDLPQRDTDEWEFLEERLAPKVAPELGKLFGLEDSNLTLAKVFEEAEKTDQKINICLLNEELLKTHKLIKGVDFYLLQRWTDRECFLFLRYSPRGAYCLYKGSVRIERKELYLDVFMDDKFENPTFDCFEGEIPSKDEEMLQECMKYAATCLPRINRFYCYWNFEVTHLTKIDGDFIVSDLGEAANLHYKHKIKGKETIEKILGLVPEGTTVNLRNPIGFNESYLKEMESEYESYESRGDVQIFKWKNAELWAVDGMFFVRGPNHISDIQPSELSSETNKHIESKLRSKTNPITLTNNHLDETSTSVTSELSSETNKHIESKLRSKTTKVEKNIPITSTSVSSISADPKLAADCPRAAEPPPKLIDCRKKLKPKRKIEEKGSKEMVHKKVNEDREVPEFSMWNIPAFLAVASVFGGSIYSIHRAKVSPKRHSKNLHSKEKRLEGAKSSFHHQ